MIKNQASAGLNHTLIPIVILILQVVKLREVFPHGTGFVLVFEFMLSDLLEVVRNSEEPLTEAQIKSYMMMLLKGIAYCHENSIMHRVGVSISPGPCFLKLFGRMSQPTHRGCCCNQGKKPTLQK